MRTLSLLALALAGIAHAAPAPLPKRGQGPEHPPVLLTGWLTEVKLPGKPSVIACRADYEAVAKAMGIQNPPAVNFKTHFLFINIASGHGEVSCGIDSGGDLRAFGGQQEAGDARIAGVILIIDSESGPSGPRYLIQSFPRSAVKTVNGSPLPKR